MSDRAVSEVISYVLVFALITGAVGVVSVSGFSTLQDTRNAEQLENAERAFDVLGDNLEDIYRRDAPSRATELNLAGATLTTGSNVTVNVSVDDGTGETVVAQQPVRPVIYAGEEDRELVYVAGAIHRTNDNGGALRVRDPPWILRDDRVLVSIVGLNREGIQSVSGSTALVRATRQERSVYSDTTGNVNYINITVENTQNPDLWEAYFDSVNGIDASTDCDRDGDVIGCRFSPSSPDGQVYVVTHRIFLSIER